jgi:hypothetical protein
VQYYTVRYDYLYRHNSEFRQIADAANEFYHGTR